MKSQIIRGAEVLEKINAKTFTPARFSYTGHRQTFLPYFFKKSIYYKPYKYHIINIQSDVKLMAAEYIKTPKPKKIAILFHGLNGSYKSRYIQRMTQRLLDENYRVLCVNHRNCGPGIGLSQKLYSSEVSQDIQKVIEWSNNTFHPEFVVCAGFSLGANLVLKSNIENEFKNIINIAVSPPCDLIGCSQKLERKENRFFNSWFSLETALWYKKISPYLTYKVPYSWNPNKKLKDFDEEVTSTLFNHKDAKAYYQHNSTYSKLNQITPPTLILSADDDPIIEAKKLIELKLESDNIDVVITKNGGHVGFVSNDKSDQYWMDHVLMRWITHHDPDQKSLPKKA